MTDEPKTGTATWTIEMRSRDDYGVYEHATTRVLHDVQHPERRARRQGAAADKKRERNWRRNPTSVR